MFKDLLLKRIATLEEKMAASEQDVSYASFSVKLDEVKYFAQRLLDMSSDSWKDERVVNVKEFEVHFIVEF